MKLYKQLIQLQDYINSKKSGPIIYIGFNENQQYLLQNKQACIYEMGTEKPTDSNYIWYEGLHIEIEEVV